MEISSLSKRGWSISAISRHTGRDRKTVRAYLSGKRQPGVRAQSEPDLFDRFEPYVRQRLADDPHVRATVLFAEVAALGYVRAYPTFTRQLRDRQLRPHCEPCASSSGRAHVDIEHPAGEAMQWDWLELDDTPWQAKAFVLVAALSHSSKCRAWFSESDDQAHLVAGIDELLRRFGDTARRWRVDRMATVIRPGTSDVQRSFVPVAKHYGVAVDPCPPRHGNRKGVVEKAIDYLTQSWWRPPASDHLLKHRFRSIGSVSTLPISAAAATSPSVNSPSANRCSSCRKRRSPPRSSSYAPSPRTRWCRCGATAT